MFTGIIEEIGTVKSFNRKGDNAELVVECEKVQKDLNIGDSIAVNGCCQTVVSFNGTTFLVEVSAETLSMTTFAQLKSGQKVNLERALTPTSRMGGHIVQGHIDCKGILVDIKNHSDFYDLTFRLPEEQMKYVVVKGSVAINGISLTVAKIESRSFTVAVIPHTYLNTNLNELSVGDSVNIETDILGRYVENFLSKTECKKELDVNFLMENGFV